MRSWPSWLAIGLGAVFLVAGFLIFNALSITVASKNQLLLLPLFLAGGVLLAAGLHSLQATYDAWCGCADCMGGGCDCCGDDCTCGDCESCKGGHEGHDHDGGHVHTD
jgi:hypothetical protein